MVFELLPKGASNALSTSELVKLTGCRSARELQIITAREREQGFLILSTTKGGYFRPSDDEKQARQEINEFVATLNRRALNTLRILKAAKQALASVEGQLFMEEADGR